MGNRFFKLENIFVLTIFFAADLNAFGSKKPSGCDVSISAARAQQLVNQYVPRGSNGRASAAAFYKINEQGHVESSIYQKNAHTKQAVASTQKIVTAYTAYRMGGLNNRVVWNQEDHNYDVQGGRAILRSTGRTPSSGQSIVAHDLIQTLMNQSSNGAALAISRSSSHQSTRVFVDMMNQYSQDLIARETSYQSYFQNPAGLTDYNDRYAFGNPNRTQESTADNMARIVGKVLRDKSFTKEMARRGLGHYDGGQVVKFGFTSAAGRTVVSYIPLPRCNGKGISIALFGENTSTQFSRMQSLINAVRSELGH